MNAQLDLLPIEDSYTVADFRQPDRQTYGKPGVCKLCGRESDDIYQYSDAEYKHCYVAHHAGGACCVDFEHREPWRYVPGFYRRADYPHPCRYSNPVAYAYA